MISFIDEEIKTQNNPMYCLNPYQKLKMNSNPVNVIPQSLGRLLCTQICLIPTG